MPDWRNYDRTSHWYVPRLQSSYPRGPASGTARQTAVSDAAGVLSDVRLQSLSGRESRRIYGCAGAWADDRGTVVKFAIAHAAWSPGRAESRPRLVDALKSQGVIPAAF